MDVKFKYALCGILIMLAIALFGFMSIELLHLLIPSAIGVVIGAISSTIILRKGIYEKSETSHYSVVISILAGIAHGLFWLILYLLPETQQHEHSWVLILFLLLYSPIVLVTTYVTMALLFGLYRANR